MRSGDIISGKYRLEERLGGGGYGDVWRATWSVGTMSLGEVAIKEFRTEVNTGEIALLLRLSHPNVITLRGVEEHEGRVCLVMEYGEGGSAATLLRAYPGGVPWDVVQRVMRDVASGLAYLHGEAIVHRDVKPDNVVFAGGVAKLCDMGLAKAMEGSAASHTGHGTIAYTAPELFKQGARVTAAADVYALGVLGYELVSGGLPYGSDIPAVLVGTLRPEPVPLPSDLLSEATAVLAGCLAKSREARWTVQQVRAHLNTQAARAATTAKAEATPPIVAAAPARPAERAVAANPTVTAKRTTAAPSTAAPSLAASAPRTAGEVAVFSGTRFRYVPPGRFRLGTPQSDRNRHSDEAAREVTLTRGLWLQETPVTQAEYERVVGSNPSRFKGATRPVESVSWFDAVKFCNARSRDEGLEESYRVAEDEVTWRGLACLGYRLPTEAEWEYACRAGTTGARYGELDAIAWYDENAGGETHPVGQKQPNPWGFFDTLGNVSEWCWDWYASSYPGGALTDPTGPASGSSRVLRGGPWDEGADALRAAFREGWPPHRRGSSWRDDDAQAAPLSYWSTDNRFGRLGLRLSRSLP